MCEYWGPWSLGAIFEDLLLYPSSQLWAMGHKMGLGHKLSGTLTPGAVLGRRSQVIRQQQSVLKCRFYYYSGMVRLTDEQLLTIEKTVCYSHKSRKKEIL